MSTVLFLSNHFITLYSFRKELIAELCKSGHDVYISTPEDEQNTFFKNLGCRIIPTAISRHGMNPLKDFRLILQYRKIMKQVNPDVIFSYTIKPNIYGAFASNSLKYKQICNITGTGATFLTENLLSKLCRMLYKVSVKKSYKVFFQNSGDRDYFISHGMIGNNYDLLPGSGCNLIEHKYTDIPDDDTINFLFVGRIMKIKGIDEYLACAEAIKKKYPNTMFYIAGWTEEKQYVDIVKKYQDRGIVQYIGFRKDINDWIQRSTCVVLPSHGGEGIPNVLLEASAMGRPCIASNINGSKDAVCDGVTGYLFDAGNTESLIDKAEKFINLPYEEKIKMGINGRRKIENEFDRQIIIDTYMKKLHELTGAQNYSANLAEKSI